jgi:predicted membrane chloride channel (bestrophin family)
MEKYSISFTVLVLVLGLLIGSVAGSLIEQVFGFPYVNMAIPERGIRLVNQFYLIENLTLKLTPASIVGFMLTIWLVYRKGKA